MRKLYAVVAIFLVTACGSAPQTVVTGAPGHRDVLFDAEIQTQRVPGMSAYDLVNHLRPEYLRSRGTNSFRDTTPLRAVVYIDGLKYGSVEQMRNLSADRVFQVRYLSAADATTRFGMDHGGGAILITTR
jgi:hypothetical protein